MAPSMSSIENPKDPMQDPYPSAWQLDEAKAWTDQDHVLQADFNLCCYGPRHWKEQTIKGSTPRLDSLSAQCTCTEPHIPVIGKEASRSGAYPPKLCRDWAKLIVTGFELILAIEILSTWTDEQVIPPTEPVSLPQAADSSPRPNIAKGDLIRVGKWGNTLIRKRDQWSPSESFSHDTHQPPRKPVENGKPPSPRRNAQSASSFRDHAGLA